MPTCPAPTDTASQREPGDSSPCPPSPPFLDVWVEAGREGRVFTYSNPEGMPLAPGDLVEVRLQGRRHAGLVVGCRSACPASLAGKTLQPVLAILERAAVHPRWQQLIGAVARLCHASFFRTLRGALPPGWLGLRRQGAGSVRQLVVVRRTPLPPPLDPPLPTRQQALLLHLEARGGERLLRDLVGTDGFGRGVVKALEERGLVCRQPMAPSPPSALPWEPLQVQPPLHAPNPAQAAAVANLLDAPPGAESLLWGVTGSGKTEVYLQVASAHLAAGRCVVLLTPEIGLVPQLLDRTRRRLGSGILEYHSGMAERDRVACWRACLAAARQGRPLVVVGTRSAVFLPLSPLGLVVLDEEHDGS
ncbi:MAG: DEAD/DEAH box helicase, partial [Cyanobacteriota bacterium]